MSRAESMAKINTALSAPPPPPPPSTTGDTSIPPPPPPAATSPAPAPPRPGSKEAKEEEKRQKAEEKAAEAEQKAAEEQEQEEKARQASQVDALTGAMQSTLQTKHPSGLDFLKLHNIGSYIESLPTPGTFMFPLILLLLFFFVLIPVNGHTRIVWLWMAITGSAIINPAGLGGSSGHTPSPPPPAQPPAQAPMAPLPLFPTSTLVEGS